MTIVGTGGAATDVASLLLDCRAYELVTAANAGGYDVESDLVPLQTPFAAYPNADDRVLYGLHYGSIPNIAGSPPNYGVDPYVAERTSRWLGDALRRHSRRRPCR